MENLPFKVMCERRKLAIGRAEFIGAAKHQDERLSKRGVNEA